MSTTYPIRPIRALSPTGMSTALGHAPEEASQTFSKGAVLVMDGTSGEIEEAGADDDQIVGVAIAAASGTAGTDVIYIPATPDQEFVGQLLTDDDDDTDDTIEVGDLNEQYGLLLDAGEGFWHVDKGETRTTGQVRVVITRFIDPAGTINGRVGFRFLVDNTNYSAVQTGDLTP